jgi:hypothetical protein
MPIEGSSSRRRYSEPSTLFRGRGMVTRTSVTFEYRFSPSSKIGENSPVFMDTRTM